MGPFVPSHLSILKSVDIWGLKKASKKVQKTNGVCTVRGSKRDQNETEKGIKIISKSVEEYDEYAAKLVGIEYYAEHIIKYINNPDARRHMFKDERKLTVGMSKKDIMNCRGKVKNAFYF